jgi:hypothetical protein
MPKTISAITDKSNENTIFESIFVSIPRKSIEVFNLRKVHQSLHIHCLLLLEVTLTELLLYLKQEHVKRFWIK